MCQRSSSRCGLLHPDRDGAEGMLDHLTPLAHLRKLWEHTIRFGTDRRFCDPDGAPRKLLANGIALQAQIQIIATAIGKPTAMAPAMVKVKAKSRFTSGRTWSTDMSLTPLRIDRNPCPTIDGARR
jgi:hypothetical protein